MTNLIEEKVEKSPVFNSPRFLSIDYIPKRMLFRDDELESILDNVSNVFKGLDPSNMLIHGPPGTGKTHGIKRIINEFEEYARGNESKARMKYFSCKNRTLYQILTSIAKTFDPSYPTRGYGEGEVVEDISKYIDQEGGDYIFVFDEIDKIKDAQRKENNSSFNDLIYFMTRLGEYIDKDIGEAPLKVSIVLISNRQGIKSVVEGYNRSTFHPTTVFFRDYNADELKEIIEQRCKDALKEDVIQDGVTSKLAAVTRKENHDLRFSFEALRKAGKFAEKNENHKITEEVLDMAIDTIQEEKLKETIQGMNETELMTLWSIIQGKETMSEKTNRHDGVSTRHFYSIYSNICSTMGIKEKSQPHLTQRVTSRLESQGFISTVLKGRGRSQGVSLMYHLGEEDGLKEAVKDVIDKRYGMVPEIQSGSSKGLETFN